MPDSPGPCHRQGRDAGLPAARPARVLGGAKASVSRPFVLAALWMLIAVLANAAHARADIFEPTGISGRAAAQTWLYPESAVHRHQRAHASGLALELTAYWEDEEGRSLTLTPYFRYDAGDPERTHADLREAYLLLYGDVGQDQWEVRLGVDRVFWGVVEVHSLVDIVNQTDLVEHPNQKTKLGQPMLHATWSGEWGALEFFAMTWHRERTFPGPHGRHRAGLVVAPELTTYESAAERWHLDFALRYSGTSGPLDVGLSAFDGTSREASLLPTWNGAELVLAPHYEQIRQLGLDGQLTTGPWLLKLETIYREGARNGRLGPDLQYEEEDYLAFIAGGEYTVHSVWDSDADLVLIAEWTRDERGRRATNAFENDVLLGVRLGLNDVQGTEWVLGVLASLDYDSRVLTAEFKRRLSDRWSLHMEASAYVNVDEDDPLFEVRGDSFVRASLDYSF